MVIFYYFFVYKYFKKYYICLGSAIILLEPESNEEKMFRGWMKQTGKKSMVSEIVVEESELDDKMYAKAREKVAKNLTTEKVQAKKKRKLGK